MRTSKIVNANPATLCLIAAITLVAATVLFYIVAPKYVHAAENDTVVAKTVKKGKKSEAPKPRQPERVVIGALTSSTIGHTVPDAPADTAVARMRNSGLVESHVRMRLVAYTETGK